MRRLLAVILASSMLVLGLGGVVATAGATGALHVDSSGSVVEMTDGQYHPDLGQFVAPDPARAVFDSATYSYANSNPMTTSDPLGLWPTDGSFSDGAGYAASNVVGMFGVGVVLQAFRACEGSEKGSCGADVVAMAVVGGAGKGLGKAARAARGAGVVVANSGSKLAQGARYPLSLKVQGQLANRGWTTEAIDEPSNRASRCVQSTRRPAIPLRGTSIRRPDSQS